MFFDGSSSKEGSGSTVVFLSRSNQVIFLSHKLLFENTNYTNEYEALIHGLKAAKNIKVEHIEVFGYSKLVIKQIKNAYQTKQSKIKIYKNEV